MNAYIMNKRVLVVDDEREVVDFLEQFLMRRGVGVVTATSGAQALDACKEMLPDCVFLDIQMPGKDGLAVLKDLRGLYPQLNVIMITGKDEEKLKEEAAKAGALDYVTKPLDLGELSQTIKKHILGT